MRIVAPMLAIETVAAGGGSICDFDGVEARRRPRERRQRSRPRLLRPRRPACASPTSTSSSAASCPSAFRFRSTARPSSRVSTRFASECRPPASTAPTRERLADGFLAVANANMAAAIKRVSVAKGYDVRDYALVSFRRRRRPARLRRGRRTRDPTHPAASLRQPALRLRHRHRRRARFAVRDVGRISNAEALADVEPMFATMETSLREQVLARRRGSRTACETPIRRLDLRYRGQDAVVTVAIGRRTTTGASVFEANTAGSTASPSRAATSKSSRRARRIDWSHAKPKTQKLPSESQRRRPSRSARRRLFRRQHGAKRRSTCAKRSSPATRRRAGADRRAEQHASWSSRLDRDAFPSRDDLRAGANRVDVRSLTPLKPPLKRDPIELELFNNRFASIAEQMGETLRRTVAVDQRQGTARLLAARSFRRRATSWSTRRTSRCTSARWATRVRGAARRRPRPAARRRLRHERPVPRRQPSAGRDGRHAGVRRERIQIALLHRQPRAPRRDRRHAAGFDAALLVQSCRGRRADPRVPFRPRRREPRRTNCGGLLTTGPFPSRSPDDNLADIRAQIAANKIGADLLQTARRVAGRSQGARLTWISFGKPPRRKSGSPCSRFRKACIDSKIRSTTAPGSRYPSRSNMDRTAARRSSTSPAPARLRQGNLNANPAIVRSAVLYCFRCLIAEDVPLNDGVLAPVKIVIPPGTIALADPQRRSRALPCGRGRQRRNFAARRRRRLWERSALRPPAKAR